MKTWSWSSSLGLSLAPSLALSFALSLTISLVLLSGALAASDAAPESADPASARKAVEDGAQAVLSVLDQGGLTPEQRRQQIEQIAYQRFDFVTMSKLVVARPWRKFSQAQKKEFVSQFKLYLSRNYGTRIDRYQQTGVAVVGHVVEPRGDVTVKTQIVGGEFNGTEVDYRMRYRKGVWKAIDVVIEGVSLVSNFRSQFQPILTQGGPEELLRRLAAKNAELATAEGAGDGE